ncbi:MAG: glutamine amidotransferase [Planctomycetota bacterium]|nr:glutamine amidotransferase [Planctomycetota bacterium]
MSHWSLQPILNSYLFVAAVAAALGLLLVVGPAVRRISRNQRIILTGLRLFVIALVAVAMLRPTHVSTTTKSQTATLVVLFDQSRSLQLPDASAGRSRWQAETETLRQSQPLLQELARTFELRVYGFDSQLRPNIFDGSQLELPEKPAGDTTDIGTSLHDAVQRELGKRLAGVILLSDGVQTAFEPKVEIQEAGRELGRLGYPLYTIGFGLPGEKAQSRDVAVDNLEDQYTVFVKNELPLRATLQVRGYVNQAIQVELLVDKPDGQQEVLGPLTLTAREDGQQLPIEMRYVPAEPGRYKLTLHAAEQPGELVTKNNRMSAFLRVLEGGVKILYVEGELRPEQKFLRRALDASPDMAVEFQWIDHRHREHWPVDLSSQLKDSRHDVFILGDLDATALGPANGKLLAEAVERGKGLALLGGYHSFGAGGYRDSPLADVVPVLFSKFERQDFDAPLRKDLHLPGPLRMLPVRPHPILSLAPEAENLAAWKQLPPLTGANKFAEVKDAAGAAVIAEAEAGQPLLVVGEYGRGRALAMAGDSTWRWWMHGQEAAHKRFWRQAILWLVRREDLEQNEVWIKLAQRRFHPGARVSFTAGAKSAAGDPITDAKLTARLLTPDEKSQELRPAREDGHWTGTLDAVTKPGDYAIEIMAEKDGQPLGTARGEFLVFDQDVELSNPAADYDQLARLAALTKEAGGRPLAPEQLPALLQEIRDRPPQLEVEVQTKWQLADTPRDAWLFFLTLVMVLSGEWFLRKKWGLV